MTSDRAPNQADYWIARVAKLLVALGVISGVLYGGLLWFLSAEEAHTTTREIRAVTVPKVSEHEETIRELQRGQVESQIAQQQFLEWTQEAIQIRETSCERMGEERVRAMEDKNLLTYQSCVPWLQQREAERRSVGGGR